MPSPATKDILNSWVLSATALKELQPDWSDPVIEDWLNILENFIKIANLLDVEIDQKIEEIPTDFADGSIPYAESGKLTADASRLFWDTAASLLKVTGIVQSTGRRMGTVEVDFSMSPYTILLTDEIIWVDASLGNVQLLFPSAVDINGQTFAIEKIDSTDNTVEATPDGFELINGDIGFTIYYEYESIKPTSTGSNWLI